MDGLPEAQKRHLAPSESTLEELRLVIAIDYGTTYTGVAYAIVAGHRAELDKIDVVQDWGPGMGNHLKIPSIISYSRQSLNGEQQWGSDLSPQAIAMVHTKLQLDVDDPSFELDLILQDLEVMHNLDFQYIIDSSGAPRYPRKGPEEIVTDYLTKVLDRLLLTLAPFMEAFGEITPVDIVATVPVEWSYRAKNSLFRALTRAGFNNENFPQLKEMLLISEPDAAAIYMSRLLKEKHGANFLKKGKCFVLCDAGGATVDVVSYRVKQLQPNFEIERVTLPTGSICGSVFVNLAFKKWLRQLLGADIYKELDQTQLASKIHSRDAEGERMRALMKRFDIQKLKFRKGQRDIKIDLPEPFENLDIENKVIGGQITITYMDMASFFEPCMKRIIELIHGQCKQCEHLRPVLKDIFLVGGFAESTYLQESIREWLNTRGLCLGVADTSWTAVVRGAAISGVGKSTNKALTKMSACSRSYGVVVDAPFSDITHNIRDRVERPLFKIATAKDQLMWLIKKGDLILSNQPKEVTATFIKNFTETDPRTGSIPIYVYDGDSDILPESLANSMDDLSVFHVMNYDLKDIPLEEFDYYKSSGGLNPPFYAASLSLTIKLAPGKLNVKLLFKDRVISSATADDHSELRDADWGTTPSSIHENYDILLKAIPDSNNKNNDIYRNMDARRLPGPRPNIDVVHEPGSGTQNDFDHDNDVISRDAHKRNLREHFESLIAAQKSTEGDQDLIKSSKIVENLTEPSWNRVLKTTKEIMVPGRMAPPRILEEMSLKREDDTVPRVSKNPESLINYSGLAKFGPQAVDQNDARVEEIFDRRKIVKESTMGLSLPRMLCLVMLQLMEPIFSLSRGILSAVLNRSIGTTCLTEMHRLTWTCRCGYKSYDDFIQLAPGGINDLVNELQNSGFITSVRTNTSTNSSLMNIWNHLSQLQIGLPRAISQFRPTQGLPVSEQQTPAAGGLPHQPTTHCKFLHVCIEKGRYSTRMHYFDTCKTTTDRAVFHTLRKDYKEIRREINSMLFKIQRIDFVEFQMYPKALVDSLRPDQLPPPENHDYEYHPMPKVNPPVGRRFMMHMWHCPEEVPEKDYFCKFFPKKKYEPCKFEYDSPLPNLGWGLHIVETLNISLVVWILFGFTAVAGMIFGVFWSLLKSDVSGAYTIASYITALLTLLLMAIASAIAGL